MSDIKHNSDAASEETWIGVVSLLPDGEQFALAWVRRRDEWLADAALASRGDELATLAQMYLAAVAKRGHPPDKLNVRAAAHRSPLRERVGPEVTIEVGFDERAQALSDAAALAVDVAFGAEAFVRDSEDEATTRQADYDPDRTPDPATWLAMEKQERQRYVRSAHLGSGTDMADDHLQLHVGMHDAIETQLARNEPPETAATLMRLRGQGLGRHDALHAIAHVLMRKMHEAAVTTQPFDLSAYVAALADLTSGPG